MAANIIYNSKNITVAEFQKKADAEVEPAPTNISSSYIIIGSIPQSSLEIPGTDVTLQEVQRVIREDALSLMREATDLEEFIGYLLGYLKGYTAGLVNDDEPFSASFNLRDAELSVHISLLEKLGFWECYIDKDKRMADYIPLDFSEYSLMMLEDAIRKHGQAGTD